jgi:hypothetical protein
LARLGSRAAALVLLLAAGPSSAGVFPPGAFSSRASGGTGAAFLKAASGARTASMGNAGVAAAHGSESVFHNPAALGRFEAEASPELSVGYQALLADTYAGAFAYSRPVGRSGVFAGGLLYASQEAQSQLSGQGDEVGRFTPYDVALGGWYAHRFERVGLGGGLKLIRSKLLDRSGSTAAVDFGARAAHVADIGEGPLDLGFSFVNLGPPIKLGSTADPLPFTGRLGTLWRANQSFDLALDLVFPVDQDPFVALGLEKRLLAASVGSPKPWSAALRLGYEQARTRGVDGITGVSAGFGLDIARLRMDYAWVPSGDLGTVHRFTLAFRFEPPAVLPAKRSVIIPVRND